MEENLSNHDKLKSDVKKLGYGYTVVHGVWQGTRELTLMISAPITPDFRKTIMDLGRKYKQATVIIKDESEKNKKVMTLINCEPEYIIDRLPITRFNTLGQFYTALHKNDKKTFKFEPEPTNDSTSSDTSADSSSDKDKLSLESIAVDILNTNVIEEGFFSNIANK
jgi:hypothetical protein